MMEDGNHKVIVVSCVVLLCSLHSARMSTKNQLKLNQLPWLNAFRAG